MLAERVVAPTKFASNVWAQPIRLMARLAAYVEAWSTTHSAAMRVSCKVEAGRDPDSRDLEMLGIEGPVPKVR